MLKIYDKAYGFVGDSDVTKHLSEFNYECSFISFFAQSVANLAVDSHGGSNDLINQFV